MNRKSRSITPRSSIFKRDVNREDDTGIIGARNRRSSRRVSFAEMCQIKEFPRDSPKVYKDLHPEDDCDENGAESSIVGTQTPGITGLDKPLTGAIQTPYQDVAEYPIPVLDAVDMETTQAGGNIDTFLPQMDFQSEPSMEIKFDASSFLKSLNGKSSDRLETMQIYSPNRTSGPSFTSQFNVMEHDKENVIPMEAISSFGSGNHEPPASVDSKLFLQRLFGGITRKVEEDQNEVEEMDETACIGDNVRTLKTDVSSSAIKRHNDVTQYFDNEDVTAGIEETKCIGGIVVQGNCRNNQYFDNEDVTAGIEETKCIGGIVVQGNCRNNQVQIDKENSICFANQTVNMEETKPIGGILKETKAVGSILRNSLNDKLNLLGNQEESMEITKNITVPMEITRPIGGFLDKSRGEVILKPSAGLNKSLHFSDVMEETNVLGGILDKSVTKTNVEKSADIDNTDKTIEYTVAMEETRAVGRILEKAHRAEDYVERENDMCLNKTVPNEETQYFDNEGVTVGIEETKCIGGIVVEGNCMDNKVEIDKEDSIHFANQTVNMEETKPVGGILKETKPVGSILRNSLNNKLNLSENQEKNMEITKNITVPMEMTRPVGGFLDKSRGEVILKPSAEGLNKSLHFSDVMEETKALGGILDKSVTKTNVEKSADLDNADKTVEYTVAMEETRAVGRILEKAHRAEDYVERGHDMCLNKTLSEPVPVNETKTVGGILNKTSDRTMYFDDVKTDWLSKDLKSDDTRISEEGTTVEGHNKTVAIEETNSLGGILTSDMEMMKGKFENIYNHTHDDNNNRTVLEPVHMEETRCVTEVTNKDINKIHFESQTANTREIESPLCGTSFKSKANEEENLVNKNEDNYGNTIVDDEITFKCSNKRNFDECQGETQDRNEEKTRELTQTGLAKLREMLILSKRKTASSLRQGDIRTPSKLSPLFPGSAPGSTSKTSCSTKLDLGVTRSPVHKKQRLSEGIQGDDEELGNGFGASKKNDTSTVLRKVLEDDGFTTSLFENSKMSHADVQGIDDEQMPDTMHIDLCTSDTHSDKNSSVHSDPVSTTVQESNETYSSSSDTRNSSNVNLSMFSNISNKSFAYSSVAPDGPLMLESFFKLTFTLASKIQGTRCSTIFAPSIDMDDMAEVLHAEMTLNPLVQAKKKMKELLTQQIQKSETSMEWLEKSLEETQPEIFQIVAKASSEELQQVTAQLRSLYSACHKEGEIAWKQGTKQMFTEALQDIQGEGVRKAEEMLQKVESDNQCLDNLLKSLDDEMESLDRSERRLEELQDKQDMLHREMEKLSLSLQEKSAEENELHSELQSVSQKHRTQEIITMLKHDLVSHLICCEWNLDEFEEDKLAFTFLDDKLELLVNLTPGVEEKQISNIVWRSKSSSVCRYFEDRVAVEIALSGISTASLRQKFTTISSLPKLVHEVSSSVNEIRMFCKDLEDAHLNHVVTFNKNSVCTELWDRDTLDFITVTFTFDPSHPLTNHAKASVAVRIGGLKSCDIEERLGEVSPGPGYLSRLIKAVDFKQFQNTNVQK